MAPKVSEEYKEKKRKKIVEIALSLFGEKGYHATTIDDIVERSNSSKGSIYTYFKSKEEIYLQMLDTKTTEMMEHFAARFQKAHNAIEKIRAIFNLYRDHFILTEEKINSIRVQAEFWINSSRNEELRRHSHERYQRFLDMVETILIEGKANGEFRDDLDCKKAASFLYAAIDGIFFRIAVISEQSLFHDLLNTCEEAYLKYIKKSKT